MNSLVKKSFGAFLVIVLLLSLKAMFLFSHTHFHDLSSYDHIHKISSFPALSEDFYTVSAFNINTIYYIIQGFLYSIFGSVLLVKIVDICIFLGVLLLLYLTTLSLSKSHAASLFSILLFGIVPGTFVFGESRLLPEFFILGVLLSILYVLQKSSLLYDDNIDDSFLKKIFKKIGLAKSKSYFKSYYILVLFCFSIVLLLTGAYALFFALVLLFTISLLLLHNTSIKTYLSEFTIFISFISFVSFLYFNREALFIHGFLFLQGNIPIQLLQNSASFDVLNGLLLLGAPLLLGGFYGIYYYITNTSLRESKNIQLYISGFFISFCCYIIGIGNALFFILFMGVTLSIIFASYASREITHASTYYSINWSKERFWSYIILGFISAALLANYVLAFTLYSPGEISSQDVSEFSSTFSQLDKGVVITEPRHAGFVKYITNNDVIMDSFYLEQKKTTELYSDIISIFTNINSIKVQSILNLYNTSPIYIYIPDDMLVQLNITAAGFAYDQRCFSEITNNNLGILYEYTCEEST